MSKLAFVRKISELNSVQTRKAVTGGKITRILSTSGLSEKKGLFGKIVDWVKVNVGWLVSAVWEKIQQLGINFTKLWERIVSGTQFIMNFNFAASDEALEKGLESLRDNLIERQWELGGYALGASIVSLVGGGLTFAFNEAAGMYLLKEAGPEILQDLSTEVAATFTQWEQFQRQRRFNQWFIKNRRLLKKAVLNPNDVAHDFAIDVFGKESIEQWGEKNGNWTINSWIQKQIEKLPEKWQGRVESFLEGLGEGVIETGYTIAGALDRYFFEEKINDLNKDGGKMRQITLIPNRDQSSERLLLYGSTQQLMATVPATIATAKLLDNRDLGSTTTLGSWDEMPVTENVGIEVMFEFFNYPEPPYWTKERRDKLVRSRLIVPNCNPLKLSWNEIKQKFVKVAFRKGEYIASATLDSGRGLRVFCGSEQEGEDMLEKLAYFSHSDIVYPLEITHRTNINKALGKYRKRNMEPQYLSSVTITNWNRLTKFQKLKGQIEAKDRKIAQKKLKLFYETEPSWFKMQLAEVLKKSDREDNL